MLKPLPIFALLVFACAAIYAGDANPLFPDNEKPEVPVPEKGALKEVQLFNGKDFSLWAGDPAWWKIENGEIVGYAPKGIGHNTFLQSKQRLGDFRAVLKVKLVNEKGNSGIQFRSQALPKFEAKGYQADAGPDWWGKIYEEHGRALMAKEGAPEGVVKKGDWNLYEILCVGSHIRTAINGVLCSELNDPAGAKDGVICFQLHSGGPTEVRFKDIQVEVNPPDTMKTSPQTKPKAADGALTADEERATFTLPEGFVAELVCSEPDSPKVVDIAFDDAGRMWALTATEYPLDGNEQKAAAMELYAKGGKDRILVFDKPYGPGPHKPRVFADNLAMPMAVLPYKNGALVAHGSEILYLEDTDGDGKADKRSVLLSGFGIQDSHLLPHRFVRGPGDWVYFAQGAFNYSNVNTREGTQVKFDQCKVGRFKLDGSRFEVVGAGLNNIWGFAISSAGEFFVQEANDCGFPVVPFYTGATYPGGGMLKVKPYAPWQTPLTTHFQMGGTGLSGLALSEDGNGFPAPYDQTMFLANPITNRVQQVKIVRNGSQYGMEKLPDFLTTTDKWFRPIAIHFGPDGGLYIVDWYNKIISHNEVPRNHPERDKFRSRVWRIRHKDMVDRTAPDLTKVADADLIAQLANPAVRVARAAWRQIADRKAVTLAPQLKSLALNANAPVGQRLLGLWSLESLGALDTATLTALVGDKDKNVRREAIRATADAGIQAEDKLKLVDALANEVEPQVRYEALDTLGQQKDSAAVVARLLNWARGPVPSKTTLKTPQGGVTVNTGEAADRDFERYRLRAALEPHMAKVAELAKTPEAANWPAEARAMIGSAIGGSNGIAMFMSAMSQIQREWSADELTFVMQNSNTPAAAAAISAALKSNEKAGALLRQLLQVKDKINGTALNADIAAAMKGLLQREPGNANTDLMLQIASGLKLKELEPEVTAVLTGEVQNKQRTLSAMRALAAMGSENAELLVKLAKSAKPGDEIYNESVAALASSKSPAVVSTLVEMWPNLPPNARRVAVDRLTSSPESARLLLKAVKGGEIKREEIDGYALNKLQTVLAGDADLADLMKKLGSRMKKSLRMTGTGGDFVATAIDLNGPFTVETWVKLDPGISNADAILGAPGKASLNFYDGKFRVWLGTEGDVVVARKPTEADQWQHIAATRGADGKFKIYLNGELDATGTKTVTGDAIGLNVGRSTEGTGTAGRLAEFRVWTVERTADEIREWSTVAIESNAKPKELKHLFGFSADWGPLNGKATVEASLDFPPLLSMDEAKELRAKYDAVRAKAQKPGDIAKGKEVFTKTCAVCHKAKGEGADIGPPLDGAGVNGIESLLRNILQPSAAVESGFRVYRVETTEKQIVEGLLFSQNDEEIVIRRPGQENARMPRKQIKRSGYTQTSIMPEGVIDGLTEKETADLFAYLLTLK